MHSPFRSFKPLVPAVGVIIALALGGCESTAEETAGLGGCWVLDGSQDVLVLLSKDGDAQTVVSNFGEADYITAESATATLWLSDSDAARLVKITNSGTKELYLSGFVRPGAVAVDSDTGDVYLADTGALEVDAFDTDGNPLWQSGLDSTPIALALAGGNARVVLVVTQATGVDYHVLGLEPADGATVFDLDLGGGYYDLSADPDTGYFWLAVGDWLEKRSLDDGSLLLTVGELGSPRVLGAMGDGCWVFDAAGRDLFLVDSEGDVTAEVDDLPGTPELSTLDEKVWLSVRDADLVALYDSTGTRKVRVSSILDPSPLAAVR
jgi:DNA-binding beta-propeller fold protein YncE